MPTQDFSRPLIGAGASAHNDFAHAEAKAGIDFTGTAQFKRGFKTEVGITAFTSAGAGVSKFIAASVEGTAFASARAGIQGQLPLNLFKEFGFVVQAEAVAEAAAGVKASLGINVGDFVQLALRDKNNLGLPVDLLLMLLDEVEIGGTFYVDVSVSAKAHCMLSLSGTLLPKNGEPAGFRFTTKAGAGLAKGVGMSFRAGIGFKDFRRFYGRATDRTIDEVLNQILLQMPGSAKALTPYISAFGPVAKISLRLAYDIGEKIIENNIGKKAVDAQSLCNACVCIILEEVQRFSLEKMATFGLQQFCKRITELLAIDTTNAWQAASVERNDLARILSDFPSEPFQPTSENISFWENLVLKAISLTAKLFPGVAADATLTEQVTLLYCAAELSIEAIRAKVNTASAYVVLPATGITTADTQPFTSALVQQPPPFILNELNTKMGHPANQPVGYADLLQYIADDVIIDQVLAKIPELKAFIQVFKEDFGDTETEIMKLLLSSAGSFIQNQRGKIVPKDSLRILVKSIDRFLTQKFSREILTEINQHVSDPTSRMYLEEVLMPCIIYIKDVALNTALDWENSPYTNDDFTEALAGVMMMFLGRSVVLMSDTLLTATQNEVKQICDNIALQIENNDKQVKALRPLFTNDQVKQLFIDTLRVGGEVLGPLPDESRKRLRMLLYQIFDIIKPGQEQTLLNDLKNQFYIPNVNEIQALCKELTDIAKERFILFAEKVLVNIGKFIMDSLKEFFLHLLSLVVNWEKNLADSLLLVAGELRTLDQQIVAANAAMIVRYRQLERAYDALIGKINSTRIKNAIKTTVTDRFMTSAELLLKDHLVYKLLPVGVKVIAENSLRATVSALLSSPLLQPVYDIIDAVANEFDDLLPDAKRLNANDNLSEQFLDLLLDKIEAKIRRHFGSTKPGITVGLNFSYHVPARVITPAIGIFPAISTPAKDVAVNIELGKVEINLSPYINLLRDAIQASDYYHDKLNDFVVKLGNIAATELEKQADELRKSHLQNRHQKMNQILSEISSKTPDIQILSPLHMSVYKNDLLAEFRLTEVAASYLGIQTDEIQRVYIILNGKSLPLEVLPPASRVSTILNGVPILNIKYPIVKSDLQKGINTFTVFVAAKGGIPFQQQRHFIYNPEGKILNEIIAPKNSRQILQQQIADAKTLATRKQRLTFKDLL